MSIGTVLRIALILSYTVALGLLATLVCLIVPEGRAFVPFARLWARLILLTCGVRVTTTGASPRSTQPTIYMANHQSQFDIPALVRVTPGAFRFVAKRELLYVPLFGWALWLAGFVFLPRADREKSIRQLESAISILKRGISVIIFPEGTRSSDGCLLPFKKGGFVLALQAGVPIVPVAIRGSRDVLPKGSLAVRSGRIEVAFMTPVETSGYSYETKEDLMERVRRSILGGMTAPERP